MQSSITILVKFGENGLTLKNSCLGDYLALIFVVFEHPFLIKY